MRKIIIYMNEKTGSYRTKTEGALKVLQKCTPTSKINISVIPSNLVIVTFLPIIQINVEHYFKMYMKK